MLPKAAFLSVDLDDSAAIAPALQAGLERSLQQRRWQVLLNGA